MTKSRKSYMKEHFSKPEVKQRLKEYYSKPEVKQRLKQYYSKPEVKQRKNQTRRKYYSKREKPKKICNNEMLHDATALQNYNDMESWYKKHGFVFVPIQIMDKFLS